jgi:nucleoside-diphosphate-sugar epimerase
MNDSNATTASGSGDENSFIISPHDSILVTGASGFIGSRVVRGLIRRGFQNLVCLARPSGNFVKLEEMINQCPRGVQIRVVKGDLLSPENCAAACKNVALIYHLAAGIGEKSFAKALTNYVVTTRNLLEAIMPSPRFRRFVLVSSFSVYSNRYHRRVRLLDESCPTEKAPEKRGEAYCVAKVRQEELVVEYCGKHKIPFVVVRPGSVYGEGKGEITGRVGLRRSRFFLHLGGSNTIPFSYVENCAEAIILAGLIPEIEGEVFNIVDDELPSSRQFLKMYKQNVGNLTSIYVPHALSYILCYFWEKCSEWSGGRLAPVFNRSRWHAEWKKTRYSNAKLKATLGWIQNVSTEEGLRRYFQGCSGANR